MNWITRERPKIDRIACPWLILRFIDAQSEFHYVPADRVLAMAKEMGATPYDVPGVELTHVGELLIDDSPHLFFMHFWANDDVAKLTHGLRAALDLANVKHGS